MPTKGMAKKSIVVSGATTAALLAPSSTAESGWVYKKTDRATTLKAKVHCGTPEASFKAAITNVEAIAPIKVATVVIAIWTGPKTAIAQPTRQPLYPHNPALFEAESIPANIAVPLDTTVAKTARVARLRPPPIIRPPSRKAPDTGEFKNITCPIARPTESTKAVIAFASLGIASSLEEGNSGLVAIGPTSFDFFKDSSSAVDPPSL
mmetsp:Transcript_31296/g.31577  ORF Transcript_31296/g.31577 Transcript_31296/m.31577 type:complete len:207 (-) Transcript_31296:100-720(-)